MRRQDIRNIVIIAHVDHGKTTLVDCLLRESGEFRDAELRQEQILDTNELERERGITILSKNIAISYRDVKINIIDTPGHADFGGEVERVIRMADGAVVLVDAAEGPMPQTRFVLSKALECKLKPIVVINKIDRPDSRAQEVLDETFELLMELGADEHLADFPFLFATSKEGYATDDPNKRTDSMELLLDTILDQIPGPEVTVDAPLQMLVTTLDWSAYVGRIAIGRIQAGEISRQQQVEVVQRDGVVETKVGGLFVFHKLGRLEVEKAEAGDVVAITGLDSIDIGDTICAKDNALALPRLEVDEPTLEMVFSINSSPFAGRDGKYVTTRQVKDRLYRELESNVALRVRPIEGTDSLAVAGRGILHLSVLIETMRREGYEMSVGKPMVILRQGAHGMEEPFETLVVEVPEDRLGPVMEMVGERRGAMMEMGMRGEYANAVFSIPARGLIGLRTRLLNATQGTATIHHRFETYRAMEGSVPTRTNGVLVSNVAGKAIAYALNGLQQRAEMFVGPGDEVYEGMIVGENAREHDEVVNPSKEKKLTNMRAAGTDANIFLKPPRIMSLEMALEYIEDGELVEITPTAIRLRKVMLKEADRRRAQRQASS